MTADSGAARALVAEKATFRDLENTATQTHFTQLRTGQDDRFDQSALHLDLLRDLKRVNAHLVASAAYPVLDEASAAGD
jgi:phosphate:Na+ symporter